MILLLKLVLFTELKYSFFQHVQDLPVLQPVPKTGVTSFIFRSSHLEVYLNIVTLKNFAKFTTKHLCRSIFLNKVIRYRPETILKRDFGTDAFL